MGEESESSQAYEELLARVKSLENKIEHIKAGSIVNTEDQLFFGVIISFFILFVTLPMDELTVFLQDSFNISSDNAFTVAQIIRYFGIILLLLSAITRYYAAVGNQTASKKYRYISLEFFIFAFASILIIVLVNLISALSFLTPIISVPLTLLILMLIFFGLNRLEIKMLKFYSYRGITAKRYTFPFSSVICLSYTFGNNCSVFLQLVLKLMGITDLGILQHVATLWLIFSIMFGLSYVILWFNLKPTKDSDYYKLKKYIQSLRQKGRVKK